MKCIITSGIFLGLLSCKDTSRETQNPSVESQQWPTAEELESQFASKLEGNHRAYYLSWSNENNGQFDVEENPAAEVEITCAEGKFSKIVSVSKNHWDWAIEPQIRRESDPSVFPGNGPMLFLERPSSSITLIIKQLGASEYMLQWDDSGSSEPFGASWIIRINGARSEQSGTGQPATRTVVEPEGGKKPQPEAEERSR